MLINGEFTSNNNKSNDWLLHPFWSWKLPADVFDTADQSPRAR